MLDSVISYPARLESIDRWSIQGQSLLFLMIYIQKLYLNTLFDLLFATVKVWLAEWLCYLQL